jgi:hypothetical protein
MMSRQANHERTEGVKWLALPHSEQLSRSLHFSLSFLNIVTLAVLGSMKVLILIYVQRLFVLTAMATT